jgi:peptidoglycan/xylan/chitin deacetylase (PgdA/CDA1 family)
MARILALHGTAEHVNRRRFVFRNITRLDTLHAFLAESPPFVPIADALGGRGDALTIDDATQAAAHAARLARAHGHAVSLFVNPAQVESGEPYWFALLHALVDGLAQDVCDFDGRTFDAASPEGQKALHNAIKVSCWALPEETDRAACIRDLADRWRVTLDVPPHLATLGAADLRALRDAGVAIENHGWSHLHHAALAPDESLREIRRGREWLQRELGVPAAHFAVPYGDVGPHAAVGSACATWLTLSRKWPEGPAGPDAFNRAEPAFRKKRGRSPRKDQRSAARRWLSRLMRRLVS